jgi:hypothetical protein
MEIEIIDLREVSPRHIMRRWVPAFEGDMRTLTDFREMHYIWFKGMVCRFGFTPQSPYDYSPIEMTAAEFRDVQRRYAYHRENVDGEQITIYGHPIRIVREPAAEIYIPVHHKEIANADKP